MDDGVITVYDIHESSKLLLGNIAFLHFQRESTYWDLLPVSPEIELPRWLSPKKDHKTWDSM
jgi:hypothetical protein